MSVSGDYARLTSLKELMDRKKESKQFYENQIKILEDLISHVPDEIPVPFNKFANLSKDDLIRAINILQNGDLNNLSYVKEIILKLNQASQITKICGSDFSEIGLDELTDLKGYEYLLDSKFKYCINDICRNSKSVSEVKGKLDKIKENYVILKELTDKLDRLSSCNLKFNIDLCNMEWIGKVRQINLGILDRMCNIIGDIKSVLDYSIDCDKFMVKSPCYVFKNIISELRSSFNEATKDLDRAMELAQKYEESKGKLKEEADRLKRTLRRVGIETREEVVGLIDYKEFLEYVNVNLVNKKAELGIGDEEICILDTISKSMDLTSTVEEVTEKCNVLEEIAIKKNL